MHGIFYSKRLISLGSEEIAKLLIDNGALVNHRDNRNESAIQTAAIKGNLKIVELLSEHGAEDVDIAMNLAEANGKLKKRDLK